MPKKDLFTEVAQLEEQVHQVTLPPELKEQTLTSIDRLARMAQFGGYSAEYEQLARYIDWIVGLPWDKRSEDILDLARVRRVLDRHHYGLAEIKERLLEYLAVLKLRQEKKQTEKKGMELLFHAPILCFVGLVGTGKTTIAYSIAEAMGRRFERIPFGGMGSALDLRGESRVRPDAEVGQVLKAIRRSGVKNPVVLLDEIDRVTEAARADIMGVLIELLDPEQNSAFTDHYIGYPFDLSEVLFVTTANNTTNISPPVLDRLEPMQMPSYTDEEKVTIGRDFILPRVMDEMSLPGEALVIEGAVWPKIVRPLGYDAGIRTLERTINTICRRVAKKIVEGRGKKFQITLDNVKEYLPT